LNNSESIDAEEKVMLSLDLSTSVGMNEDVVNHAESARDVSQVTE